MEFKTTRNLGEKVFVLYKDKIECLTISTLIIRVDSNGIKELFELYEEGNYRAILALDKCFATKEELIKSLE